MSLSTKKTFFRKPITLLIDSSTAAISAAGEGRGGAKRAQTP